MYLKKKSFMGVGFLCLVITLTVMISYLHAQDIWKYYTTELPGVVFDMTQDKHGNYWFATDNGVCELDTNGFWHILVDTTVWDTTMYFKNQIVVDRDNNKWFVGLAMSHATKEYVVKYDDSTFTYYNPSGKEEETWIQSLGVDSSGNIWAGSMANWAYWFDGTQWRPFFVPGTTIYDPILEFAVDRKGTLYIGHTNGISTLYGYLWGDFMWAANSFGFDKDNRLWFGTDGWGVGIYDGVNWMRYTTNDGLLSNHTRVVIDSICSPWISYGPFGNGVSRFKGHQWESLTHDDGLLSDTLHVRYVDRKGDIWFASIFSKGLSIYTDTTTTNVCYKIDTTLLSENFILYQNYPNPFNSKTVIRYELSQIQNLRLSIYNLTGEEVINFTSGKQQPGIYQITWYGEDKNGKEVTSGIYLAVLKNNSFTKTKKITLLR